MNWCVLMRGKANLGRILILSLILVAGVTVSSALTAQRPNDRRQSPASVLAISSNPRAAPVATPQDFLGAIDLVYRAGARGSFVSWSWKTLEPSPGVYKVAEVKEGLNYLGNVRELDLLLGLQVINTTAREAPSDLATIPFDAMAMKKRFHILIDVLRPYLNRRVKYLSIGNEVDVYLATHPQEWGAYQSFYRDGVAYVHAVAPWIKVGVTATYDCAVKDRGHVADLNSQRRLHSYLLSSWHPLDSKTPGRAAHRYL